MITNTHIGKHVATPGLNRPPKALRGRIWRALGLAISTLLLSTAFPVTTFAQTAQQSTVAPEQSSEDRQQPDAAAADSAVSPQVIAYYFHTTQRCASCRKIEEWTAEALDTGFAEERKTGLLAWKPVNIDEKEHEHFVKEYQLYTKSVILVDPRSEAQPAWKNLNKVWELLGSKETFVRYIQTETRAFLTRAENE